jgi:hypothetical protein
MEEWKGGKWRVGRLVDWAIRKSVNWWSTFLVAANIVCGKLCLLKTWLGADLICGEQPGRLLDNGQVYLAEEVDFNSDIV